MFLPQYARVIPEIFDSEEVSEIKRQKFLEEKENIKEQMEKEYVEARRALNITMNKDNN